MKKISISRAVGKKYEKKLPVGTYVSVVTSVGFSEKHLAETALEIKYELTATDGRKYPYREIFENDDRNPRTAAFFDKIESYGISLEDLGEFEGFQETLVLKQQVGKPFLTIESRSAR